MRLKTIVFPILRNVKPAHELKLKGKRTVRTLNMLIKLDDTCLVQKYTRAMTVMLSCHGVWINTSAIHIKEVDSYV